MYSQGDPGVSTRTDDSGPPVEISNKNQKIQSSSRVYLTRIYKRDAELER